MSLRWWSYVASKLFKKGSKIQNGRFPCKIALRLKKVCYEVSLCENCQRQSRKAFIGLTTRLIMIGGGDPFYLKFWVKLTATALGRNRRFFISIFARSASAVTPSEKVQLTLIGSPPRAFQWAQDEHRTLSLSLQIGLKNAKCLKFK